MKYLLLLFLSVFSFTSNAQFVTGAYDAQKMVMNAENLVNTLIKDLKQVHWQVSFEEIYIMPEGGLNIPMIELYFTPLNDTSDPENNAIVEDSYWIVMYMFDKSEEEKVRAFFVEHSEPELDLIFFETAGTFSCMYPELDIVLGDAEKYEVLKEALAKFFKDHYDEM